MPSCGCGSGDPSGTPALSRAKPRRATGPLRCRATPTPVPKYDAAKAGLLIAAPLDRLPGVVVGYQRADKHDRRGAGYLAVMRVTRAQNGNRCGGHRRAKATSGRLRISAISWSVAQQLDRHKRYRCYNFIIGCISTRFRCASTALTSSRNRNISMRGTFADVSRPVQPVSRSGAAGGNVNR